MTENDIELQNEDDRAAAEAFQQELERHRREREANVATQRLLLAGVETFLNHMEKTTCR